MTNDIIHYCGVRFRSKRCWRNIILLSSPTPRSAVPTARRRLHPSVYERCLHDSGYCRGGCVVDANGLTHPYYVRPVRPDRLRRHRRRALAASRRHRIRTRVVGVFVAADLQPFDSRADAQTPDVADQEVDVIALHCPLVTEETQGHHQRYPGPSTAPHGPAGSVRTSCSICIASSCSDIIRHIGIE